MAIKYPENYSLGQDKVKAFPRVQYAKIKEIIDALNDLTDGSINTTDLHLTGDLTVDGITQLTGDVTIDGELAAKDTFANINADGAIPVTGYNATFFVNKAGVAAMTIPDPTSGTQDNTTLTFISTTANAHTLSNSAGSGFNGGGAASDLATFGGAKGDGITLVAKGGVWYIKNKTNITLS